MPGTRGSEDRDVLSVSQFPRGKSTTKVWTDVGPGGTPSRCADGCFSLCPHVAERESERARVSHPLLMRALTPSLGPPSRPHDLVQPDSLPEVHLLMPPHWRLGVPTWILGRHKHSMHTECLCDRPFTERHKGVRWCLLSFYTSYHSLDRWC